MELGTEPVVLLSRFYRHELVPMLVNPRTGRLFGEEITTLMNRRLVHETIYHVRRLAYGVGAMVYHCTHLAQAYVRICRRKSETPDTPGITPAPLVFFSGNEEPYFDFDALVTAARRIYDSPRGLLWRLFRGRRGEVPGGLERVLDQLPGMPDALRAQLRASWSEYGQRARNYRDCATHFADIEYGLGTVDMIRHPLGVWSALVRIPDNPEAKSRSDLTFEKRFDALDFALDLTAELAAFTAAIVEAAAPRADRASEAG